MRYDRATVTKMFNDIAGSSLPPEHKLGLAVIAMAIVDLSDPDFRVSLDAFLWLTGPTFVSCGFAGILDDDIFYKMEVMFECSK